MFLVTGVHSGFGKYCHEFFDGVDFNRQTDWDQLVEISRVKPFEAIIHAASSAGLDPSKNLYQFFDDNLLLVNRLAELRCRKFIFISSVDVYPKNSILHAEDEMIDPNSCSNLYALSKLVSESIVQSKCDNYLILRPSSMLGRTMRKNSLVRLMDGVSELSLSRDSNLNYVLYEDVVSFIQKSLRDNICGIYNLVSSSKVSLGEVADKFSSATKFGDYVYEVGDMSNQKAVSVEDSFLKSSMDNIATFFSERG